MKTDLKRIVVGISGASGAIYGLRLLQALSQLDVETHLVMSEQAGVTIRQELNTSPDGLVALAQYTHANTNLAAPIASGSFVTQGMLIVPCSIKTLSAVANSYNDTLMVRAADVMLKEGRPLILAVRETPLHLGHLRLMSRAAEMGAVIFPPVPAMYAHPTSIEDLVDQSVGRMLARLGLDTALYRPWQGLDH